MEPNKAEPGQQRTTPAPPSTPFDPTGGIQFIPPPDPGRMFFNLNRSYPLAKLGMALLLLAILPTMVFLVRQRTEIQSQAASPSVFFYMNPGDTNLPPNSMQSVMIDTRNNKINFVTVVINFDPNVIKLAREVNTTSRLKVVIQKTPLIVANKTGEVKVSLALDPKDVLAPSGTFEVLELPFVPATAEANVRTAIQVSTTNSRVNDEQTLPLQVTSVPAVVTVNVK